MAAERWSEGNYIDYTPSSAVTAGDIVVLNATAGFVGIAECDIAANALGALAIRGIFKVTKKDSADVFAIGSPALLAASTNDADLATASTGHIAVAAAGSGTTEVLVLINCDLKVQS